MATANPIPEMSPAQPGARASLLVQLAPMPPEQLENVLDKLMHLLPVEEFLVATADPTTAELNQGLRVISVPEGNASWTFTASDFVSVYQLAQKHEAKAVLMLGRESHSLSSSALFDLCGGIVTTQSDLIMPRYDLPPNAGLVNSAILYPLTRALFVQRARYPLAVD